MAPKSRSFIIGMFLFILFHLPVYAQDKKPDVAGPETKGEVKLEKKLSHKLYSPTQFAHESILFIKKPAKWQGRDWLRVGGVVAFALCIMPFDERIAASSQGYQRYTGLAKAGTLYGEWYSTLAVAGTVGAYGIVAHDTATKKVAIELLQGGLYAELMTAALKVAIGRARPLADVGAFKFSPPTLNYNYQAMPSGHTTSAFALSTVMSRHAHSTWLKILAYFPAGLTMFARIYQNQHWLSDEILGAAIGVVVGNWVVNLHEGKRHKINVTSVFPIGVSYAFNK